MSTPLLENKLDNQELEKIIAMYESNISLREISRRTGLNRATLSRMLERLGVKTIKGNHYRKYFFDFDFFEKIDTQEKAYWLGFLYADGCVLSPREYGEQTFKIQIGEKDRELLELFKKDIKSTYPIREDNSHHRKNPKHQKMVLLEQRSQKTVDDLKRLGCFENKSLVLVFPNEQQVPNKFIYHFIRGYFDGDGSIVYSANRKAYNINIVGTENFIKKLATYFKGGSVYKDKRKQNSWYFNLSGNLQVIAAYKMLYSDAHRYMTRKYNIFQSLLNKYSES